MYGTNATVDDVDVALQSLMRSLKQTRLRDHLRARAGVDLDQAGLAVLYVLHTSQSSLRLTELAEQLRIDAPAVTRKAQQLERTGLVGRTRDEKDARGATRLYSLAEFDLPLEARYERDYLLGKYGAVPVIGELVHAESFK